MKKALFFLAFPLVFCSCGRKSTDNEIKPDFVIKIDLLSEPESVITGLSDIAENIDTSGIAPGCPDSHHIGVHEKERIYQKRRYEAGSIELRIQNSELRDYREHGFSQRVLF